MKPPDTVDLVTCRSCETTVRLVVLVTGVRVPAQPDPVEGGRLASLYSPQMGCYVSGRFLAKDEQPPRALARWWFFEPHSGRCGALRKPPPPPPADVLAQIRADIAKAREADG